VNNTQFTIEKKISESTTTSVYRAFDAGLHRRVLLKVLHGHLAHDEDLRARFIREARACAALRSEHIVQVYDLTEVDQAPAIVMEFVEGKSLKDVILDDGKRNFDAVKKIAVHILRGLALAHEKGIIHRDIKPGNILVADDGVTKITDFGLASFAMSPTVTMEGMVLGTPAYMAPEQVRGEDIDPRTDLFSLGVTLVEALSGERIFEGSTYSDCMKKVLAFREPDLQKFAALSSDAFVDFLKKLMAAKRSDRFASAIEALAALGEKKSDIFLRQAISGSYAVKRMIPGVGTALVAVLGALLLWSYFTQRPSDEGAAKKTSDSTGGEYVAQGSKPPGDSEHIVIPSMGASGISSITTNKTKSAEIRNIDSGKVFVTSTPWAKVFIDDALIGETPMAKPLVLPAGRHTIMFTNPAFDPILKSVAIEGDKEITVKGDFFSRAGFVACSVTPWAEIFVDEQPKGITPLKPIILSAGKHSVRFRNPAFEDIVKEVVVAPKDTVRLSISFTQ